jgi:hypothetical protein
MNKLPLIDLAKKLSITPTQCRYWSKLCGIEIEKSGRISYLPESAERLLNAMSTAINGGLSPSVAANEVMATHAPVESPAPICTQDTESAARINELEKAVLLLAESNQAVMKQNQDLIAKIGELAAIINKQSKKIDLITHTSKATAEPCHQQPRIKKNAVNLPLYKRLWYELFNPEYLRATP